MHIRGTFELAQSRCSQMFAQQWWHLREQRGRQYQPNVALSNELENHMGTCTKGTPGRTDREQGTCHNKEPGIPADAPGSL